MIPPFSFEYITWLGKKSHCQDSHCHHDRSTHGWNWVVTQGRTCYIPWPYFNVMEIPKNIITMHYLYNCHGEIVLYMHTNYLGDCHMVRDDLALLVTVGLTWGKYLALNVSLCTIHQQITNFVCLTFGAGQGGLAYRGLLRLKDAKTFLRRTAKLDSSC